MKVSDTNETAETQELPRPQPRDLELTTDDGWGDLNGAHDYASNDARRESSNFDIPQAEARKEDDGWGDVTTKRLPPPREIDTSGAIADDETPDGWGGPAEATEPIQAAIQYGHPESMSRNESSHVDEGSHAQEVQEGIDLSTLASRTDSRPAPVAEGSNRDSELRRQAAHDAVLHAFEEAPEDRIAGDFPRYARHHDVRADSADVEPQPTMQELADSSEAYKVSSVSEAETFAKEELGFRRTDLGDFDLASAREVNASLDALRTKYPQVDGLDYLGSIQSRNATLKAEQPQVAAQNPDVVAEPTAGEVAVTLKGAGDMSGISFNERWVSDFSTAQARMRLDEAAGFSAQGAGSMRGVVAHEFGHAVENHLRHTGDYYQVAGKVIDDVTVHGGNWITENVGFYAKTSPQELFAELFAEYQCSEYPRETAQKLGLAIDKHYWNI